MNYTMICLSATFSALAMLPVLGLLKGISPALSPELLKVRQEDVGADDASAAPSLATTGKVAAVANPFARKKENSSKRRQIPETYTVEEGDTLMRISAKFYGTNRRWRDIRDANKEIISSDGRVKMGQVIKLP